MRRTRSLDLVPIDLDINKTLQKLNQKCKQQVIHEVPTMGDENHGDNGAPNRALKDYFVPNVGLMILRSNRQLFMIQSSVQFRGLANDDPNLHIAKFLEICDTFKHNGVTDDAVRLRLFPFYLNKKAKAWSISLPLGTITTWDVLFVKIVQVIILARSVKLEAHMKQTHPNKNQGASIHNLEHQVEEISKLLMERTQGALHSITETNPKEHVKAITIRSGKELEQSKEASSKQIRKILQFPRNKLLPLLYSHLLQNHHLMPSLFLKG
ncbi:hypothetical protein AAG906_008216 [Vitis piasezkii]